MGYSGPGVILNTALPALYGSGLTPKIQGFGKDSIKVILKLKCCASNLGSQTIVLSSPFPTLSLILVMPVSRDQVAWETIPPLLYFPLNQRLLPSEIQGFGVFNAAPAPLMPSPWKKHSHPNPGPTPGW